MLVYRNKTFLCFCLILTLSGKTHGHEDGPGIVKVFAVEGGDAILPCSLSTSENIVQKLFDWKKDGQNEVFMYDAGVHYNNDRQDSQDQQFKGRVSHFPDQLKFGNASIIIRNTTVTDSGTYTCDFPRLQSRQIFYINLVIGQVFKDRSGKISGAVAKPVLTIVDVTKDGVLLQCVVQGASPKPTLQWKDSDGNILPAEEPQVSETRGHCDVILQTTVTKTTSNCFYCEVKQEELSHVVNRNITVPEKLFESCHSSNMFTEGWFSGFLTAAAALALFKAAQYLIKRRRKGFKQQEGNGSCNDAAQKLQTEVC